MTSVLTVGTVQCKGYLEHIHLAQLEYYAHWLALPIRTPLPPPTTLPLLGSLNLSILKTSHKWNQTWLSFCDWLKPLCLMSEGSSMMLRVCRNWLLFYGHVVFHGVSGCTPLPTDGHQRCFRALAPVSDAAVNAECRHHSGSWFQLFETSVHKWDCWIMW